MLLSLNDIYIYFVEEDRRAKNREKKCIYLLGTQAIFRVQIIIDIWVVTTLQQLSNHIGTA